MTYQSLAKIGIENYVGDLGYLGMSSESDSRNLKEVLRAVEMFRREVRMRNKVELYKAILSSDSDDLEYEAIAETVNQVYADMYVLRRSTTSRGEHAGRGKGPADWRTPGVG